MAEAGDTGITKLKKGKVRAKKLSTRIDMTPMVDLAFLLLTFFILTTTLAEQKKLDILLPSEGGDPPLVNNAITVILSNNNKIFYYTGKLKTETELIESDFKNIRNVIADKNKPIINNMRMYMQQHPKADFENDSIAKKAKRKILENPQGVYVIIKYDSLAKYRNTIDMLDEMDICGVSTGRYAVVNKLEPAEKTMLLNAKKLSMKK